MVKVTEFNKSNLNAVYKEINEVLAKYGLDSNLEFSLGNVKYDPTSFRVPLTVKIKGEKTFTEKKCDEELKLVAQFHNLTLNEVDGKQLVGYNSRRHKYPFTYKQNGKLYKTSLNYAKAVFDKSLVA